MTVDLGTFLLVHALEVPRSTWANRRDWYQTGANSAHELHMAGVSATAGSPSHSPKVRHEMSADADDADADHYSGNYMG